MNNNIFKVTSILFAFIFVLCCSFFVLSCSRLTDSENNSTQTNSLHEHNFDEWTTVKRATCTEEGLRERYCSCGEKQTTPLASLGHDFVVHDGQLPSCTQDGWHEYRTCSRCEFDEFRTIPALGHEFGEWELSKESSCYEKGEEKRVCLRCETYTETKDLQTTEHTEGDWITNEEPSCEGNGLKIKNCTVCGEVLETEEMPALGHDFGEWEQKSAPNCTDTGEEIRVCKRNELHTESRETDALGHSYEWTVNAADCENSGLKIKTCTVCEQVFETEEIPALGHDFGEWKQTSAPNCTDTGEEIRVCKRNNLHTESRKIAALGHSYGWHIKIDGHSELCAECGNETELSPHEWNNGVCAICGFEKPPESGLSFERNGDAYTVTGIGTVDLTEIEIPSIYSGLPVTAIAPYAFEGSAVTKIIIPNSVIDIGKGAFKLCENLACVVLSENLSEIGEEAFYSCAQLKELTIPENVKTIGANAFYGCNLTRVEFENKSGWYLYEDGEKLGEADPYISDPELAGLYLNYYAEYIWKNELI